MCSGTDECKSTDNIVLQINDDDKPEHHRTVPLVELALENITYAPFATTHRSSSSKNGKSRRRIEILSNVSTVISPHQLSAWMGPSGSGELYMYMLLILS